MFLLSTLMSQRLVLALLAELHSVVHRLYQTDVFEALLRPTTATLSVEALQKVVKRSYCIRTAPILYCIFSCKARPLSNHTILTKGARCCQARTAGYGYAIHVPLRLQLAMPID